MLLLPAARTVTGDCVVLTGRIGYDLDADPLLLHTFVSPAAWTSLRETGVLRCGDEHVAPVDDYAYQWMRQRLAFRTGVDTWPLWLWAKISRADLVAAARRYARNAPGTVLLTCRVPQVRALVSHFGDWHCVLNGQPALPWSLSDQALGAALDQWYARVDEEVPAERRQRPRSDWPAELLNELETSWLQIFDRAAYPRRSYWQACVAEIVAGDVVDAVRLAPAAGPRTPTVPSG